MWNGARSLPSLSTILQSSFKVIYHDETTIESSKRGTLYNLWGEKFDFPSIYQNLEV